MLNAATPEDIEGLLTDGPPMLDLSDPLVSARKFVEHCFQYEHSRGIQHQGGVFYEFVPEYSAYREVDEATVRARLYRYLDTAFSRTEKGIVALFRPTRAKVENILDALRAVCNLPASQSAPCWTEKLDADPDAHEILACSNGLLHLPTRRLIPASPRYFALNGVEFPFDARSASPQEWLSFLSRLWPDDHQSIGTLQEWMGLLLTDITAFQKILMIVGPKRSGKGTIARVIRMLIGERNVCGPTLSNMAEQFGLSVLIGKSAAIIADARISGRADTSIITERLLSISGEDAISIPRKFLPDWTVKLSTRFTLMTNELPKIEDASGALSSRFVVLTLNESFYGREDHQLLERFVPELPGIFLWALDGLERLRARGRFEQPASSQELIQQFEDLGSPVGAFLRERCEVNRAYEVAHEQVFEEWKNWCQDNGRKPGTTQNFSKDLRAAVPWIAITRPRIAGHQLRYWQGLRLKGELQ